MPDVECNTCKTTGKRSHCLQCTLCQLWTHFTCVNIKSREEADLKAHQFVCPPCQTRNAAREIDQQSNVSHESQEARIDALSAEIGNLRKMLSNFIASMSAKPSTSRAELNEETEKVNVSNPNDNRTEANKLNDESAVVGESNDDDTSHSRPPTPALSEHVTPDNNHDNDYPANPHDAEGTNTHQRSSARVSMPETPTYPPYNTPPSTNQNAAMIPFIPPNPFTGNYWNGTMTSFRQTKTEPLPRFDGSAPDQWVSLEAVYNHLKRTGFQKDELIAEISTAIQGYARRFIQDQLLIRGDPDDMMATLRQHFGDPRRVLGNIVKSIEKSKPPRDVAKEKLIDFALLVKSLVTTAKAFKMPSYLDQPILCDNIVDMLRDKHRDWWAQQRRANPNANLETLSEYLMERATDPSALTLNKLPRSRIPEARLHVHDQPNKPEIPSRGLSCFKCQSKHRLRNCNEFLSMNPTERFRWIKGTRICSCCLSSTSHFWTSCPYSRECTKEECNALHHPLLHISNRRTVTEDKVDTTPNATTDEEDVEVAHTLIHRSSAKLLYKIIPVMIESGDGTAINTFAFLDLGSNHTLIDRDLYNRLQLPGTRSTLRLKWTQEIETTEEESFITNIRIKGPLGQKWLRLKGINTVSNLSLPTQSLNSTSLKRDHPYLRDLPIASYEQAKPLILIGLQHARFCLGERVRSGRDNEPMATKSPLGWVVFGHYHQTSDNKIDPTSHCLTHNCVHEPDDVMAQYVKEYFSIDNIGISPTATPPQNRDDYRAETIARSTLKKIGRHYEIGLTWRHEDTTLPDNYRSALNRLKALERSLHKKPEMVKWIDNRVDEMIQKGYVREATKEDLEAKPGRTWYLPTFVTGKKKPRFVFDGAAKHNGTSLNDHLLKGPDLVTPLVGGLCHFREGKYVVIGDAEEMYHQVAIRPNDQNAQRFLWRGGDQSREPTVYILQVMAFGTAPSSFLSQFVKNEHAKLFLDYLPEAARAIIAYMYVDDYLNCHDDVETAIRVTRDVLDILDDCGFRLRALQSNSKDILERLPQDRLKPKQMEVDLDGKITTIAKILGTVWDPETDQLTYRVNDSAISDHLKEPGYAPTKRELLSTIMRIFDPLGHAAHVLIRGKILLQKAWKSNIGWDDAIPDELIPEWHEWLDTIQQLNHIRIPRHYAPVPLSQAEIELHIFTDASEYACAATGFFRIKYQNEIYVAKVMSKARVMPLKELTIPRAELTAAVIGARLAQTIIKSHTFHIQRTVYWTDSKCVLTWLNSSHMRFKAFIKYRLGEILETSTPEQWRYIPSDLNVADDATKKKPGDLDSQSRWYIGPEFLAHEEEWPVNQFTTDDKFFIGAIDATASIEYPVEQFPLMDNISDRFSTNWRSLARVVSYRLKFLRPITDNFLTPEDQRLGEAYIYRYLQSKYFGAELQSLKARGTVAKNSQLYKLSPKVGEDGIIRVDSRLQYAKLPFDARNPVILPNEDPIVDAIIRYHHDKCMHVGEATIINSLRETTWILRVKKAVKRVKRACKICDEINAMPRPTRMGNLPSFRTDHTQKPFTHVGVDVCGPFEVLVGRRLQKRWVMIFTCLVTRAVHFEVLEDMTADRCLVAIQDFTNVRGPSHHFYSDCGKNFEGAANKYHINLRKMSTQLAAQAGAKHCIHWHFNPARTPHWGGAWERLIAVFKRCLKAEMRAQHRHFTPQHFRSAVLEVTNRMNSRPLTHIPLNTEDEEPLTPNHFLLGNKNASAVVGTFTEADECSRSLYRRTVWLANRIWARFVKEYTPSLALRNKWEDETEPIEVGDLVLLAYPNQPRNSWRRGIVIKVHPGKDGRVRCATVREADRVVSKKKIIRGKVKFRSTMTLARLKVRSRMLDGGEIVANQVDHPNRFNKPGNNEANRSGEPAESNADQRDGEKTSESRPFLRRSERLRSQK